MNRFLLAAIAALAFFSPPASAQFNVCGDTSTQFPDMEPVCPDGLDGACVALAKSSYTACMTVAAPAAEQACVSLRAWSRLAAIYDALLSECDLGNQTSCNALAGAKAASDAAYATWLADQAIFVSARQPCANTYMAQIALCCNSPAPRAQLVSREAFFSIVTAGVTSFKDAPQVVLAPLPLALPLGDPCSSVNLNPGPPPFPGCPQGIPDLTCVMGFDDQYNDDWEDQCGAHATAKCKAQNDIDTLGPAYELAASRCINGQSSYCAEAGRLYAALQAAEAAELAAHNALATAQNALDDAYNMDVLDCCSN